MLEIKMDMAPFGIQRNKHTINTIKIIRIGYGKYAYGISGEDLKKDGILEGFDIENNALGLLKMVLNECDEIKQNKIPTKKDIADQFNVSKDTLQYRSDGRIEWFCDHGVGHTIYSPNGNYVHGCDGCCRKLFNGGLVLCQGLNQKKEC